MNIPPSTGESTPQPVVVSTPTPTTPTVVTPAQTTAQQIVDTSALIAQYEQRIRDLMSQKDKALHERNQAISQLTENQQALTTLQEQTQTSLTGAANAAQQAIDRAKALETQVAELQGQTHRAHILLEKPHLAPYAAFIPVSNDPAKIKEAVDQLEQIRQQDIERSRSTLLPAIQPSSQQQQPLATGQPNILNMYQGRTNMPLSLSSIPGSTPAQMNPAGAGNINESIQQLFDDARRSDDPGAFAKAVEQAKVLSQAQINQQLGRS